MSAHHEPLVKDSEFEALRQQQFQMKEALTKLEAEVLISKAKAESAERERDRIKVENKELLSLLQKQKKDKTMLLIKANQSSYNQTKDSVEAKRYELLAKSLSQQNDSLKNAMEKISQQKIYYAKEKQQLMTRLILLQSKAEVSHSQQEVIQALNKSLSTLSAENNRLREQIVLLNSKLSEGGISTSKSLVKDDSKTIELLIKEFEAKLLRKQQQHSQYRQNYEKEISQLKLKISHPSAQNNRL